jgi:hypothetical protein
MLGFKSFRFAAQTLAGIELMHMIRRVSCCRQARCVRPTNSIRWRIKARHICRTGTSAMEVCDRTHMTGLAAARHALLKRTAGMSRSMGAYRP